MVHFGILGKDPERLRSCFSQLFGWEIDADNPLHYGMVGRDGNMNEDGVGIGGGIGAAPDGDEGHITFYVQVPDVEVALADAERLGGRRLMGPDAMPGGGTIIGMFADPEGHVIGWSNTS